jgi:hypothetical protein
MNKTSDDITDSKAISYMYSQLALNSQVPTVNNIRPYLLQQLISKCKINCHNPHGHKRQRKERFSSWAQGPKPGERLTTKSKKLPTSP